MVFYEVTLQVDPASAAKVEDHMRSQHIPAIFATGCFQRIHFDRASPARFRTSYQAVGQAQLDRYLQEHAPRFRAEFQAEFPAGVITTRETWTQREVWEE
jgi:uncharacterized protein DUF4286